MALQTESTSVPGKVTAQQFDPKNSFSLWRLFYKKGNNPRCECVFRLDASKREAIERGRIHCTKMNYKFIHVEPLLVDLDLSEAEYTGQHN